MPRPKQEDTAVEEAATLVRVRCLWPNVWTSEGKLFRGDEAELPPDEAVALDERDAVKIVR